MTTSKEQDEFVRNPKLWYASAMKWRLQNPDYRYEILAGIEIEDPAREVEMGEEIDYSEAPDLAGAVAAAHALLDKHAREAGDLGIEISVTPPRHPYPEQEQLGVRHYKLSAEARKQARALGIRASDLQPWAVGIPGGDLRARVSRMVRHAVPFDHKIANVRYRGTIMRVEDDTVTWIGLAVRHGVLAGPALARRSNRSGRRVPRSAAAQRSRLSATLGAMSASVPLMAGRRG